VFREIDPETNDGTSHMNNSSYVTMIIEGELMKSSGPRARIPHRDFALHDVGVLYMREYNEFKSDG
jgi:hypothetical protein